MDQLLAGLCERCVVEEQRAAEIRGGARLGVGWAEDGGGGEDGTAEVIHVADGGGRQIPDAVILHARSRLLSGLTTVRGRCGSQITAASSKRGGSLGSSGTQSVQESTEESAVSMSSNEAKAHAGRTLINGPQMCADVLAF